MLHDPLAPLRRLFTGRTLNLGALLLVLLLSSSCISSHPATTASKRTTPPAHKPFTQAEVAAIAQTLHSVEEPDLMAGSEHDEFESEAEEAHNTIIRYEYFQWLFGDENGNIPDDAMLKVVEQIRQMKEAQVTAAGAGVNKNSWTYIGPGKTVKNGIWPARQLSGHVAAIAINPANTNMLWVGAETGGIWKSTDAGVTWRPVNDFLDSMAISTLVVNPANPAILYAGTGSAAIPGIGLFKSTNGGDTWTTLATTNNTNFTRVGKLAITNDGNTLLAGAARGVWRSTDGGATWTQSTGITDNPFIIDVAFNPADNSKAVASGRSGSAWYSTNGGVAWTQATGLPAGGRTQIAYAASAPNIVYASVDQGGGQLWKSTDGGQSYTLINGGANYLSGIGFHANMIWVDPTNPNVVIVGGLSIWGSNNGGVNLARTRSTGGPDQHVMLVAPGFNGTANKTVYAGNDGGLFRTDDIYGTLDGATTRSDWVSLNEKLGISQVYGVSVNGQGVVLVGLQDNGTLITNQDGDWMRITFGDGGYSFADPTDGRYFYNGFIQLGVERSANSGADSDVIAGGGKAAPYAINDRSNFITPILLDPNNPERLLVGAGQLWRTNDARTANTPTTGPQWAAIKPATGDNIAAMAIAKGNSDLVWVGHNNGALFKSVNGTAATPTWTQMGQGTLPQRSLERIVIDPQNANTVYVAFGRYQANSVWRTTDGGATWAAASGAGAGALPELPVISFAIHPNNSNWLYAGTAMGLFTSENGGATWTVPHDGPTNAMVWDLSWSGTTLFAATYGRGVWKAATTPNTQVCFTLGTAVNPTGSGVVNVQTAPNCNGGQYTQNTVVTVQAAPNANQAFTGWGGDLTGAANPTTITMNGNKNVTANFAAAPATCFALTLTAANGNITAAPAPNCNNGTQYTQGTVVNLTAVPNEGFTFNGWAGAATGATSPVAVTMDGAKAVTANFAARCVALVTAAVGDGAINVAGNQVDCAAGSYPWGSTVNLTATPNAGNDFTGWQGDAAGIENPVAVLMNADRNVQATFAPQAPNDEFANALNVDLAPGGDGVRSAAMGAVTTYSVTLSTLNATLAADDPNLCEADRGNATVWFKFTATQTGSLELSNQGSLYGTILSIWTGTPGNLKLVGCAGRHTYNAKTRDVFAQTTVLVDAGQTYYIQVADCAAPEVFEDPDNPIAPEYYGGQFTLTATLTPGRDYYLPIVGR